MSARRLSGIGLAATGVVCPCHVLSGLALGLLAVGSGAAPAISPAVQDGVHALYLPAAVLLGARLLFRR